MASNSIIDFWEYREPLFAYHGIGVRATEILSCLDLPYQAIDTFRKEELQSGNGLALFIFTDDAEIYIKEIDACIQQYKVFSELSSFSISILIRCMQSIKHGGNTIIFLQRNIVPYTIICSIIYGFSSIS